MDVMSRERIPTGVEKLDCLIGGGFRQGKSYLISGETGAGKTAFGLQFLMKGLELGEAGLYITVNETAAALEEEAESLGFDIRKGIDQKMIKIMEFSSHLEKLKNEGRDIDIRKAIGELNKHVRKINARRLVIDPIGPLVIKEGMEWELQSYIRTLFFSIEEIGTTSLLTSIIPTGTNSLSQFGSEEFHATGIIVLSIAGVDMIRPQRVISVRKMRGSPHTLDSYAFDYEYGKGIVIQRKYSDNMENFSASV
jgi:circadian clock protein KaiC